MNPRRLVSRERIPGRLPKVLGGLGLSETEEAAYRCLLGRSSASAGELAVALGRSAQEVAADLATLAARGLVAQLGGDADRHKAAPPKVALGALLKERRADLRVAEQALAELAEQHRAAAEGRTVSDLIEVVTGAEAVRQRFLQVQHSATSTVRSFVAAPDIVVSYEENTAEPV